MKTQLGKKSSFFAHLKKLVGYATKLLQFYIDRIWFGPLLSLISAIDNFIVFIPTDGLLVSSAMVKPKRWIKFSFFVTLGSIIGGSILALLVQHYGVQIVDYLYPHFQETKTWIETEKFFSLYGLWLLFLFSMLPLTQQPALIAAALANVPIPYIAVVAFLGRFIKFSAIAYLASHAPHLLKKLWGMQTEFEEVGLE